MKNLKYVFMVSLIVIICLTPLLIFTGTSEKSKSYWTTSYATSFNGGTGTQTDPYLITTASELARVARLVNLINSFYGEKYYSLKSNIDLSSNYWKPIGESSSKPFSGVFYGNGFTISGLKISADSDCQGLFGYSTGTIDSLAVSGNIEVSSGDYVGGIVGCSTGTLNELSNYVNITATTSNCVGGVVGFNNCKFTLQKMLNKGVVSGNNNVGGIVGTSLLSFQNCYNKADISGRNFVGGICGRVSRTDDICSGIYNCYNTGSIVGSEDNIGGICGGFNYKDSSTVTFANENPKNLINHSTSYWATYIPMMTYCFNKGSVSGRYGVGGCFGSLNGAFSYLSNSGKISGTGSVGGIVGSLSQYSSNCKYACSNSSNSGSVTGNGYSIGGIAGSNYENADFSKMLNTGTIKNTGGDGTGGIVGSMNSDFASGTIEYCGNTGSVTGKGDVGGIGGDFPYDTIKYCYNTGSITGTKDYVGGIAGQCYYYYGCTYFGQSIPEGKVFDCFNSGDIYSSVSSGEAYIGGLFGNLEGMEYIKNCYSSGKVSAGTRKYVGALLGRNTYDSIETPNLFFRQSICSPDAAYGTSGGGGTNRSGGKATSKSSSDMKTTSFASSLSSSFSQNSSINSGYPYITNSRRDLVVVSLRTQNSSLWGEGNNNINDGDPYFLDRYW